jgi:hypothetical protein
MLLALPVTETRVSTGFRDHSAAYDARGWSERPRAFEAKFYLASTRNRRGPQKAADTAVAESAAFCGRLRFLIPGDN